MYDLYEKIKSILLLNKFDVSEIKEIDYGIQFQVSFADWSGILRIYQNKKGKVNIDYSQLKGGRNSENIISIIENNSVLTDSKTSNQEKFHVGFPVIGTDESGKGDYFGPLVSAGVYVDEHSASKLRGIGVKDSKKIKDKTILSLAGKIDRICGDKSVVIEISPERYNDLYEQFKREGKNLNTLLAWGHAKAIEELLNKVDCKIAIADQFADEKFILSKLQEKGTKIKLIQMHKAEQNIAVAAASILARERFITKLSKLSREFRIELPKGASTIVVEQAKKFIGEHGSHTLLKVAKIHFKTTKQVLSH